jgi:hypothetical protein
MKTFAAFFKDKYNKLIVPVTPLNPSLATADMKTRLDEVISNLSKQLASESGGGRESVQTQQWARDILPSLSAKFWQDPEVVLQEIQSLRTSLLNRRHGRITEAGYDDQERVMTTPALGTKNSPFVISSNPEEASRMYGFLAKTVGTVQRPDAVVFLRFPDNSVQPYTPAKLRLLTKE